MIFTYAWQIRSSAGGQVAMATDRENRVAGTDQYERDSSVSASLVLPYHPFSRSFSLARVQELPLSLSLSLPLFLLSFLRCAHETSCSGYNSKGIPSRAPQVRPFPREKTHTHARTHARTRDTRKRSKSFLLSKRNSRAEEKGVRRGRRQVAVGAEVGKGKGGVEKERLRRKHAGSEG